MDDKEKQAEFIAWYMKQFNCPEGAAQHAWDNDHAVAEAWKTALRTQQTAPATQQAGEREQERIAFKDAHRHLELYEVPDAWERPMFKHSHVEASWLGWIARASRAPADSVLEDAAQESEYRRGYRHGYGQRDAEVRGALA